MLDYADGVLAERDLGLQYSPELFNDTELNFSWRSAREPSWTSRSRAPAARSSSNFPTTVERDLLPTSFADQIECLHRNLLAASTSACRCTRTTTGGPASPSAELALMAGAQRIEGCLFGNGERAGNVDLLTLGMNLFSHGVDPGIDFSDLGTGPPHGRAVHRHPRPPAATPTAGDLVYTAFSGSPPGRHQEELRRPGTAGPRGRRRPRASCRGGCLPAGRPGRRGPRPTRRWSASTASRARAASPTCWAPGAT